MKKLDKLQSKAFELVCWEITLNLFLNCETIFIPGVNGASFELRMLQFLRNKLPELLGAIVPCPSLQWAILEALKSYFEEWITSSLKRPVKENDLIPTLSVSEQTLEVLSFVGYCLNDLSLKTNPGVKKQAFDTLFTLKEEGGNVLG